ncbi:putative carboxylesterase [Mycena galericulata]|nr:putative carboxylesterase [Mycena galericulata]
MKLITCLLLAVMVNGAAPVVDLKYATYQGYYNGIYNLNIWKGIRYAAPPTGNLRWQAPQPPAWNNSQVILAGAFGVPELYGFNSGAGDEDCLYLNVYAVPNASALPVLLWIHGGGYSDFGAVYDPSVLMNTNDNGFITVEIQYRLGAFGYLASAEVKEKGQLNAGLLDQRFALDWVQQNIAAFGGDPARVTIGGESSGAGSTMYHAMAYGGHDRAVFSNIIAASPYTPPIYAYNDPAPTGDYNDFRRAGWTASGNVSTSRGYFGSFAFLPVIDGHYIRERPSVQLSHGRVNGKRLLVGNNANDGVPLTNPNVVTRAAYDSFVSSTFPLFTASDVAQLNQIYHIDSSQPGDGGIRYDTLGNEGPTALNQSEMATGIQQTVFNLAAETVFDCPAQWLAEAFSSSSRQAWKYQYSVTPAYHGADLSSYFSIWGSFILHDSPVISVADATAGYANATVPTLNGSSATIDWPEFSLLQPWQMDLNTTGGETALTTVTSNLSYYERTGSGIVNTFRLVNASSWEGGRGARCQFWRAVSARVPQ